MKIDVGEEEAKRNLRIMIIYHELITIGIK